MSNDVSRRGHAPALPNWAAKALEQTRAETMVEVQEIRSAGTCAAAEIETNAFVTSITMNCAATLTNDESQLTSQNPLGAARYHAIADAFAAGAVRKLQRMWLED